jgi:tetratricopeptide (TPR) repeat protein
MASNPSNAGGGAGGAGTGGGGGPASSNRSPFPSHYRYSHGRAAAAAAGTGAAAAAAGVPSSSTAVRANASRLSLEGGGGMMGLGDMIHDATTTPGGAAASSAIHSPFVQGLLRFSPNNANSSSVNHAAGGGVGAASGTGTTGLSPFNRRNRTRFFESSNNNKNANTNANINANNPTSIINSEYHHSSSRGGGLPKLHTSTAAKNNNNTTGASSRNSSSSTMMIDGIPVDHLRQLATLSLLDSPCGSSGCNGSASNGSGGSGSGSSSSIFYASLLYSKTRTPRDALLLAQAHLHAAEYAACLRVLEECGILQSLHPWDGLLLACAALAATGDWQALLDVVEDACRLAAVVPPNYNNNRGDGGFYNINNNSGDNPDQGNNINNTHYSAATAGIVTFRTNLVAASRPLEDDDDFGWEALKESIDETTAAAAAQMGDGPNNNLSTLLTTTTIHPLARLCWWRGRAYHEMGHGLRAATYWKRALRMDCRMQQAWEALLERHLLTPIEAHEFISSISFVIGSGSNSSDGCFSRSDSLEWLKALYLARIELTTQDRSISSSNNNKSMMATTMENYNNNPADIDNSTAHFNSSTLNANNNNNSAMSFSIMRGPPNLDASSIRMSTPSMFHAIGGDAAGGGGGMINFSSALSPVVANNKNENSIHNNNNINVATTINDLQDGLGGKMKPIQTDVDEAFDKLWNEYKLHDSPQVLAMAARRAYRHYDWTRALQYCEQLAQLDPSLSDAAFCYIASLVVLGHKRVLFRLAHEWVEASPKSAKAWFAVGAYYFSCERYHVAQRHFCRATRLDPQCTEAWIAFGCSFAACDESDQALASFRAAQRLSPGEHTSLLYMGMEYVRTNHLVLAHYFLQSAKASSGGDPLCLHEIGVLAIQNGQHQDAVAWFQRALAAAVGGEGLQDSIDSCLDPYWEPTLFNLGHAYRKTRRLHAAAQCFARCVSLCPEKFSTYSALAFTQHLMGDVDTAINYYHQALSCKPDDAFSTEMLNRALEEALTINTLTNATNLSHYHHHPSASLATASGAVAQSQLFMSPAAPLGLSTSSISRKDDSMMSEETESSDVDMSGM